MRSIVCVLIFLFSTQLFAVKTSDIVNEAKSSFLKDDHFQSARLYTLAFEKFSKLMEVDDVENYVVSQSILMSEPNFIKFCTSSQKLVDRAAEFSFYCGKAFVQKGMPTEALKFLDAVPSSFHRLEFHLVKSTAYLYSSKSQFCIDEIKKAQDKVSDNTSQHFRDLINVTEARCLVEAQRYAQALQRFQNIRVNSDFYLETLEEQAWVQFKMRNLASSRELLGIIISNIASQSKSDNFAFSDTYFRVRYLQGYIDLIAQSTERSKQIFTAINQEILKYKTNVLRRMQIATKMAKFIGSVNSKADLESNKYAALFNFRKFTKTWGLPRQLDEADTALKFLIALNIEIARAKTSSLPASYIASVENVKTVHVAYVSEIFKEQFNEAKRTIESIQFKSNMGQIENIWAERTEGKRTIAEAIDAYLKEVTSVEEYLGR